MFEGWGAAAVAATVVGAAVSSDASRRASNAQTDAANASNQTQLSMYEQNRADAEPYRQAGYTALGQLSAGTAEGGEFNRDFSLADFTKDPGYQFRMDQGSKALQASAAARGGVLSGAALKGITRYGQDFASNEYSNAYNRFNNDRTQRFNRLSSIADTAQTSNSQIANQGAQMASNVGNTLENIGNARGAGYVGQANAVNNGISSLSNFYLQQRYSQQPQQQQQWFAGNGTSSNTRGTVGDSVNLSDGTVFNGYP